MSATPTTDLKLPPAPRTLAESGLSPLYVVEHLAKLLFLQGEATLAELSALCRLPHMLLAPLLAFMRDEKLLESTRYADAETTVSFSLSEAGRSRARDALARCQYAGPLPVTLAAYRAQVARQRLRDERVGRDELEAAFDGLTVRASLLAQLGAGLNSGRALFIHGPAGSGKTFLAEHLVGLLGGTIAVPYALLVDNEVIQLYDPLVHQAVDIPPAASGLERHDTGDTRWQLCRRPLIASGGELTLEMLELDFDHHARFYQAPPQLRANNGLMIVDDLGRQRVSAQALMNRWIVPLDRQVDYLSLHTGSKFQVPFDVQVVFSSNLTPEALADEAFLRRLPYKLHVGELTEAEYRAIFVQACRSLGLPYTDAALRHVVDRLHGDSGRPLLACSPRDLLSQVRDLCRFEGQPLTLDEARLNWAWDNYHGQSATPPL